jgi:hypothetical protein
MVIGSAGAPLYDPDTASYIIKSVKDYCYGVIETTPNSFYVRVYNNLDTLLDTLRLTKLVSGILKTENRVGDYILYPNYPNPFNNSTVINYQVRAIGRIQIVIYDITGKEVAILVNEEQQPGTYETKFTADGLSSGVYFYRLITPYYTETKRMVLTK